MEVSDCETRHAEASQPSEGTAMECSVDSLMEALCEKIQSLREASRLPDGLPTCVATYPVLKLVHVQSRDPGIPLEPLAEAPLRHLPLRLVDGRS